MGFWSKLGKAALVGGAAAAVPFSGGASLTALPTLLGVGGAVAGSLASSSAHNRGEQIDANQAADRTRLTADQNYETNLENRKKMDADFQNNAYRNAMRAALAMNTKDVSFNRPAGVPNISFAGGSRPSAIGSQGTDAAALLNQKAMGDLMNGTQLPAVQRFTPTPMRQPGFMEKYMGPIGLGLSAAGTLMKPDGTPMDEQPNPRITPQNSPIQMGSGLPMSWPVMRGTPQIVPPSSARY